MKVLYVTIKDKTKQGDYLEVMCLRALRKVLGDNCIDYPKKKILYNDWSEVEKESLHGKGFTIIEPYLSDIKNRNYDDVDVVVYGFINKPHYVNDFYPELDDLNRPVVYIDGHDNSEVARTPCFKHEVHHPHSEVFPINLAIPSEKIREIDFSVKRQVFQTTAPPYAQFGPQVLGAAGRQLYIYDDEEEYYDDMSQSWFGLSCRKGSWDALRNYEIIASGALLLFRDFNQKPEFTSPIHVPAISYSTPEELRHIVQTLLPAGRPSEAYRNILSAQREWLVENATEEKVGEYIVSTIREKIL